MNDIDQKIQAALRRENTESALAGEPNIAEEVLNVFRSQNRWLSITMVIVNLIVFAGVIWAVLRFLRAGAIAEQIQWGALGFVLLLLMSFIKLWFWLEMHTNRVLREVKRVELLLMRRDRK